MSLFVCTDFVCVCIYVNEIYFGGMLSKLR